MSNKINEAAKMAVTRALIWDARVSCLDRWASESTRGPHERHPNYAEIRDAMMSRALDGWRDAMMWGVLSDETRKLIQQAAANRFLRMDGNPKSGVMHHLNPRGEAPGQWMAEVEEQFRAEIRQALGHEPEE